LKHLKTIEIDESKEDDKDVVSYKFTFSENEFFSNDVLTKKLIMVEDE
jgi:hypothetical protein